jgi:hypothetical protein
MAALQHVFEPWSLQESYLLATRFVHTGIFVLVPIHAVRVHGDAVGQAAAAVIDSAVASVLLQ